MHQEPDIELKKLKTLKERHRKINRRLFSLISKIQKKLPPKLAEEVYNEILDIANELK